MIWILLLFLAGQKLYNKILLKNKIKNNKAKISNFDLQSERNIMRLISQIFWNIFDF